MTVVLFLLRRCTYGGVTRQLTQLALFPPVAFFAVDDKSFRQQLATLNDDQQVGITNFVSSTVTPDPRELPAFKKVCIRVGK